MATWRSKETGGSEAAWTAGGLRGNGPPRSESPAVPPACSKCICLLLVLFYHCVVISFISLISLFCPAWFWLLCVSFVAIILYSHAIQKLRVMQGPSDLLGPWASHVWGWTYNKQLLWSNVTSSKSAAIDRNVFFTLMLSVQREWGRTCNVKSRGQLHLGGNRVHKEQKRLRPQNHI